MAKLNTKKEIVPVRKAKTPPKLDRPPIYTHGGGEAIHITPEQELRRTLMACMLWEGEFYESGESVASRIAKLVPQVDAEIVGAMAVEARTVHRIRHAPLWVLNAMIKKGGKHRQIVGRYIPQVVRRPDEMTELLRMYWGKGKSDEPLANQLKKGLAEAFTHFDEYQLGKYSSDAKPGDSDFIDLWDVYSLVHPTPKDQQAQAALWADFRKKAVPAPYTWEVELMKQDNRSKGKKWAELLASGRLPAYALLSNLRNIAQTNVDPELVYDALEKMNGRWIMPFRYFAAAKHCPKYAPLVEKAMIRQFAQQPKIPGSTLVIVDVSGSMNSRLSSRGEQTRMEAACTLGAIAGLICEKPLVYATAGNDWSHEHATAKVPDGMTGMALVEHMSENMHRRLGGGGIFLTPVLEYLRPLHPEVDRVLVITDEQDCTASEAHSPKNARPHGKYGNYLVNVSTAKHGIGYGEKWVHMDTLSEGVFHYILGVEAHLWPDRRLLQAAPERDELFDQPQE